MESKNRSLQRVNSIRLSWDCDRNCLTDRLATSHNVHPVKSQKSQDNNMMFAQTGLNPTPLSDDQTSGTPALSSLWWLIPLALACVGLVWYLRHHLNRPLPKPTNKTVLKAKVKEKEAIKAPAIENSSPAIATNRHVTTPSKKSGKKSKKDRSVGERQGRSIIAPPTVSSETKSVASSDLTPSLPLSSPSSTVAPATVTSTAIFEPLRDVGQKKRRAAFSPQLDSMRSNEEAVSSPQTGGKFERKVSPASATKSSANRWPTSVTQLARPIAVVPSKSQVQSLQPVIRESNPAPIPAPTKGLTSFVSKVKNSVVTETVSAPTDVESQTSDV